MHTIRSGKILLNKYNKENNTNYSPKDFFQKEILPILFKDKKYLINWTNSKFFQYMKDINANKKELNDETFNDVVNDFCVEIDNPKNNILTTMNIFGGCAVPDYNTTTLFCVTDNLDFNEDERYCSFIGSVVALGIKEWCMVIYDEETIWEIFNGLKLYRHILNNNENLKGNQLYAWNTIYLYTSHLGDVDTICDDFFDQNGKLSMGSKINFTNLLFLFAKLKRNIKVVDFFSMGQMNKSCTTVMIDADYVSTSYKWFKQLYQNINEDFRYADYDKMFGGKLTFYKAIETGYVGKGFFNPTADVDINAKKINANIYKYLDIIMTEEQKEMAKNLAQNIKTYENNKKTVYNSNKNIFNFTKNKTAFIDGLIDVLNVEDKMTYVDYIMAMNKESFENFAIYTKAYFSTLK